MGIRYFSFYAKALGSIAVPKTTRYNNQCRFLRIFRTKNRRIMLTALPLTLLSAKFIAKKYSQKKISDAITTLTTDEYSQNLMELWSAIKRADIQNIIAINLRAAQGTAITRSIGSSKKFDGFDNLMFSPSQINQIPKPGNTSVDMQVTLGLKSAKPLIISIPLLISGMAYGIALSEPAKRALAKGAKNAGTAICSGEGPYLAEERKEADKYILQISHWPWGLRTDQEIASSNMLEIQISQAAQIGSYYVAPEEIRGKARRLMGLSKSCGITRLPAPPGVRNSNDWRLLVQNLRKRANGIPIGIKIMATDQIEKDLAQVIDFGIDVIAIDGAQGGSLVSNPTMQDDFGIPSLHALVRAVRYLKQLGVRNQVSLIVSGGYFNPGSCLKALALGADAIYLGTVPLYALINRQHKKIMPWEPPTALVSYSSKYNKKLDINLGAERVTNVLRSMTVEMEQVIRALGKTSIKDLSINDLVALDTISSELTGVKRAY